jgi:NTP pyrophosphatase (non-canonical NTP hydrolase)
MNAQASASNLTALVGELVQAVTDRADLQGNCTTLKHELANATMIANRLGRHLAVAKVNKAQLAEEIVDRNSKIQELESRLSEMMEVSTFLVAASELLPQDFLPQLMLFRFRTGRWCSRQGAGSLH